MSTEEEKNMPRQPALFPDMPETDVGIGHFLTARLRSAQEYAEYISNLTDCLVIVEEALEHCLDVRPLNGWIPGKMRCNSWKSCDHPGCVAVREIHDVVQKARDEVAHRRAVTNERMQRRQAREERQRLAKRGKK